MPNLVYFWVPVRNRLAVKRCTARQHKLATQFLGFLDELSGSDEHPPGKASNMTQF